MLLEHLYLSCFLLKKEKKRYTRQGSDDCIHEGSIEHEHQIRRSLNMGMMSSVSCWASWSCH